MHKKITICKVTEMICLIHSAELYISLIQNVELNIIDKTSDCEDSALHQQR